MNNVIIINQLDVIHEFIKHRDICRKIEFFACPQMPMNKGFLKSTFCENDAGECNNT